MKDEIGLLKSENLYLQVGYFFTKTNKDKNLLIMINYSCLIIPFEHISGKGVAFS